MEILATNLEHRLVTNNLETNVHDLLKKLFRECKTFYCSVAFISYSGLQLLVDSILECEERGVKGKILCSDYLGFTDPSSLKKLLSFSNVECKMFRVENTVGFHTKGYIFEMEDCYKILIGSSNITDKALKSNIEWNVEVVSKKEDSFIEIVLDDFNMLMSRSIAVDDHFVVDYENFYKNLKKVFYKTEIIKDNSIEIKPNQFQELAIKNLYNLRKRGENKALIIASTGVGKTYASAFDVQQTNPIRLLYIVHNENILDSAIESFKRVIKNKVYGKYTGNKKELDCDYLFSTIQTMNLHYKDFPKNEFDYIIIDEAHRSASESFQRIINYFTPNFLLGMTATPERTDGKNIFKIYDYNIASNIRLEEALKYNMLTPFHYFGINDNTVDLAHFDLENIDELSKKLSIENRVKLIIEKMEHYGFDGDKRKCLAFCVDKKHCEFMAEEFNKAGYEAISLTGEDSTDFRNKCIERLQCDSDPLQIICTVNIFNEGVDIPYINLILMLRPTESSIIFTQQLGRGLRKVKQKEFLTVLDFISNHNRCYLIAVALSGSDSNSKDGTRRVIRKHGIINTPVSIELDRITEERIMKQLEQTNFNNLLYLRKQFHEIRALSEGRIPTLQDFLKFNYSFDPMRFIEYIGNYLSFVNLCEKDISYKLNKDEENCLNYFSSLLPFKEIKSAVLFKMLLENNTVTKESYKNELNKYLSNYTDNDIDYIYRYVKGEFLDSLEQKAVGNYFAMNGEKLELTEAFLSILKNDVVKDHLLDLLEYGILRYEEEFGSEQNAFPDLKLYQTYKMRNIGVLTKYKKIHSSIRGQGLWHDEYGNYYLFVDLKKDKDIKESINYKDKFISNKIFQWQSPNSTVQNSKVGKIITQQIDGHSLHLFVRKIKKEDGKIMPYTYVGKINTISYEGNKPITILYKLENEIPYPIYWNLVTKYSVEVSENETL